MRRGLYWLLLLGGCHALEKNSPEPAPVVAPVDIQGPLQAAIGPASPALPGDLSGHPVLRAASAAVEVARGKAMQAGKRPVERCLAQVEIDLALLTLRDRYFILLTQIRRAHHDVLNRALALQASDLSAGTLTQMVQTTQKLVEAKRRPKTDLLALEVLLEEARISQRRNRAGLEAAWARFLARANIPPGPLPPLPTVPAPVPKFPALEVLVQRVLEVHTTLKQAEARVRKAGLELDQVRAGGKTEGSPEKKGKRPQQRPDPCAKAGKRLQAEAALVEAEAAREAAAGKLVAETAEAFGRFQEARATVEGLVTRVMPRLLDQATRLREGYRLGAEGVTFANVWAAERVLNQAHQRLAQARRELWDAVVDLEGLMQLGPHEEQAPPGIGHQGEQQERVSPK